MASDTPEIAALRRYMGSEDMSQSEVNEAHRGIRQLLAEYDRAQTPVGKAEAAVVEALRKIDEPVIVSGQRNPLWHEATDAIEALRDAIAAENKP